MLTSTFAAVMFASLLAGFLAIHLSNRLLNLYLCHDDERADYAVGIIPMIGIGLHSFIDGVIYSVAFNVSIFTGVLAAIGMVLHEFPEGIVTFVLLERGGFSRRRSALYAFLAAAMSTPLGALVSYPFINSRCHHRYVQSVEWGNHSECDQGGTWLLERSSCMWTTRRHCARKAGRSRA